MTAARGLHVLRLYITCTLLTSNVAYVSSWIDYLRFMREHPSLFPTLLPLISSELLEDSGLHAVVKLRDAWDEVEGRMQRDSEEQPCKRRSVI